MREDGWGTAQVKRFIVVELCAIFTKEGRSDFGFIHGKPERSGSGSSGTDRGARGRRKRRRRRSTGGSTRSSKSRRDPSGSMAGMRRHGVRRVRKVAVAMGVRMRKRVWVLRRAKREVPIHVHMGVMGESCASTGTRWEGSSGWMDRSASGCARYLGAARLWGSAGRRRRSDFSSCCPTNTGCGATAGCSLVRFGTRLGRAARFDIDMTKTFAHT